MFIKGSNEKDHYQSFLYENVFLFDLRLISMSVTLVSPVYTTVSVKTPTGAMFVSVSLAGLMQCHVPLL